MRSGTGGALLDLIDGDEAGDDFGFAVTAGSHERPAEQE